MVHEPNKKLVDNYLVQAVGILERHLSRFFLIIMLFTTEEQINCNSFFVIFNRSNWK